MADYTHRDRRAHRAVARAFLTIGALVVVLTGCALTVPLPFAGIVSVVLLGGVGVAYLGWSEGMLTTYSSDLRRASDEFGPNGFLRAETSSPVGLRREIGRPTASSPHARRRYPGSGGLRSDRPLPDRPESD